MRVGFFGTPAFAATVLEAVLAEHEVAVVVAQPDKPQGRGNTVISPPTITLARERNIPTLQPVKVRTGEFPEQIEALQLDVAVVVAYGRILTPRLLAAPRLGCINLHASLLPRWRGAAPIQWAVIAGDAETGVCTMQMDEGLDTGAVLERVLTPIGPRETSGELFDRLAPIGAQLMLSTLAKLGQLTPQAQPTEGITHARLLEKADGKLDFSRDAHALACQVRGCSPWPGAFAMFGEAALKVLDAEAIAGAAPPGQIGKGAVVGTGLGLLKLHRVQLPGKKPVSGEDFLNGSRALHLNLT